MSYKPLTVKELKEVLASLDDDMEVVIRTQEKDLFDIDICESHDPVINKPILVLEGMDV